MHDRVMWVEGPLREIAKTQHGLVNRHQILEAGVTDSDLTRRIEEGRMLKVHPGVYYLDSVAMTWKTDVLAGVMAAGPDALASHRTAALLWELDSVYGRIIEVTVPFNEEPIPEEVILHRSRRINPGAVVEGIPVTSIDKTLLDLARILPEKTLQKAARSAVRRHLTTPEKMDQAVGLYGGRGVTGTRKFRRVIGFVVADQSGSVAEIDLIHIVEDAPVPPPIQQLKIKLPDGSMAYPDLAWPDRKRLIEADGFEAHGSSEQLQHDLNRQNQLMELGWDLRRFTATEIHEEPHRVKAEIVRFVNRAF